MRANKIQVTSRSYVKGFIGDTLTKWQEAIFQDRLSTHCKYKPFFITQQTQQQMRALPMKDILWSPTRESMEKTLFFQFMQAVNTRFSTNFQTYDDVYQWSISCRELFWSFWAEYCRFPFIKPYSAVVRHAEKIQEAEWFPDARMNYTRQLLAYDGGQAAVISHKENGQRQEISRDQLRVIVMQAAQALAVAGIKKGDRIAAYMPNAIETVVMLLACASIGAIWSSCSPDFGVQGVIDRFSQIAPKLLISVDGYSYNGKAIPIMDKTRAIADKIPSIDKIVIVSFLEEAPVISSFPHEKVCLWEDFLAVAAEDNPIEYVPVPFNFPLYILYSSGTTGHPKCIVHGHGGSLLQHMKEHQLHTDIREGDKVFYFTTCGWMMWNWLVSALASGGCLVLYDGSPFAQGPGRLWDIIESEKVNVFGTSAKYLSSLTKANFFPAEEYKLDELNTLLSTGSPLSPGDFDFVYRHIKPDLCLSSISGGTDIVSCFVLGSHVLPVRRGKIQCRGLGMDVQFVDEEGQAYTGEKGELVCRQAFPSMPVCFWNDPEDKKYTDAYFTRFNNMWAHGDYGELSVDGSVVLYGRADSTLNPGGVRIGTAEIYRQVDKLDEVMESLAVGQRWQDDERIVLFVVLTEDLMLSEALSKKICQSLKTNASPRHVPAKILQMQDLPRTANGKISETAVKAVIHNEAVTNCHALANAEVLKKFRNLKELQC